MKHISLGLLLSCCAINGMENSVVEPKKHMGATMYLSKDPVRCYKQGSVITATTDARKPFDSDIIVITAVEKNINTGAVKVECYEWATILSLFSADTRRHVEPNKLVVDRLMKKIEKEESKG